MTRQETIPPPPALTTIGQAGGTSANFSSLARLYSISAPKLTSIAGHVIVFDNGSSTSNAALSFDFRALTSIGGTLSIDRIDNLTKLEGFPMLATVGGALEVTSIPNLQSITLPALATVNGKLSLYGNDALPAVTLPVLSRVDGAVQIGQHASLTTVSFPALTTAASLTCADLPLLGSLSAPKLASTASTLDFTSVGHSLPTSGAMALDFGALTTVGGALYFSNNAHITSLGGFPLLATVGEDVFLDRNRGLASAKLPSLAIVTGAVQVVSNDDLRAIAFPLVTSVGDGSQGFVIGPNAILDDLSPPASTVAVNGLVQVSGNPALPTCMAKAFAMACVSTAGTPIVMGNKADACGQ